MSEADLDSKPIEVLKDQELEPTRDLVGRVRRQIERRMVTSYAASFSWQLPKLVFLEFVKAAGEFALSLKEKKGKGQ